jgi:hypothetical protein
MKTTQDIDIVSLDDSFADALTFTMRIDSSRSGHHHGEVNTDDSINSHGIFFTCDIKMTRGII